jgi:hypothetical protein
MKELIGTPLEGGWQTVDAILPSAKTKQNLWLALLAAPPAPEGRLSDSRIHGFLPKIRVPEDEPGIDQLKARFLIQSIPEGKETSHYVDGFGNDVPFIVVHGLAFCSGQDVVHIATFDDGRTQSLQAGDELICGIYADVLMRAEEAAKNLLASMPD